MMRKLILAGCALSLLFILAMKAFKNPVQVVMTTDLGVIRIRLFDDVPVHRDNFIKLVESGYYDGLLIHRVVRDLAIQAGDPNSKNATPETALGKGGPGYTLNPELKHSPFRGALAAAPAANGANSGKLSHGSQFFIVQGRAQTEESLNQAEKKLSEKIPAETRKQYLEKGGAPQLEGQCTVFGEVVQGIEVVDRIAGVARDDNGRPMRDIKISIKVEK